MDWSEFATGSHTNKSPPRTAASMNFSESYFADLLKLWPRDDGEHLFHRLSHNKRIRAVLNAGGHDERG